MTKKINKNVSDDSDEIDSLSSGELSDEIISKNAKKNFMQTEFLEKLMKYVKTDDLIRQETIEYKEKINTLKEDKQELEEFILRYLDSIEQEVIDLSGTGKLTKYESVRKSGINKDLIKQSISEQIKKEKLVKDDKKANELAEITYNLMESKREKKTKVYLKRTFKRENKDKKKEQYIQEDDQEDKIEEKPKKKNTKDKKNK